MNALWQIILQILWRLRPVQALEVNLHDVIDMGLAMFADGLAFQDIATDAPYRATLAAAFWDAHIKADLLIYLRACEISGIRPRMPRLKPNHEPGRASLIDIWNSFHRLLEKVDDYERLAQRRAERMKREPDTLPLRLAATLQSTSPALRAVEANNLRLLAVQIASLSAQHWGRWIGASSRRDGGGAPAFAFARGPPPFPTPNSPRPCLRSPASENANPRHMTNSPISPCPTPVMVRPNQGAPHDADPPPHQNPRHARPRQRRRAQDGGAAPRRREPLPGELLPRHA